MCTALADAGLAAGPGAVLRSFSVPDDGTLATVRFSNLMLIGPLCEGQAVCLPILLPSSETLKEFRG